MKSIFSDMHKSVRIIFTAGWIFILFILVTSAALYISAGEALDYHLSVYISEKLLEFVRPTCVFVCLGSLGLEYLLIKKDNI